MDAAVAQMMQQKTLVPNVNLYLPEAACVRGEKAPPTIRFGGGILLAVYSRCVVWGGGEAREHGPYTHMQTLAYHSSPHRTLRWTRVSYCVGDCLPESKRGGEGEMR